MTIEIKKFVKQIAILQSNVAVNVQWAEQIIENGIVAGEKLSRKTYSIDNKDEFISEVPNAGQYLLILGWQ